MNRPLVFALAGLWLAGAVTLVLMPGLRQLGPAPLLVWLALGAVAGLLQLLVTDRRLAEFVRAFRRVGEGDFAVRLEPGSHRLLRELARAFNDSAFRTGEMVHRLEAQREMLDSVIAAMDDGVLVVDRLGRITLANAAFRRLCGRDDVDNRFHWEAVREPELAEALRTAGTVESAQPRRMEIGSRVWLCRAARLERTSSVLVTFHDITDIEKTVQMKREFVRNVAHELRTPLAAIKGFVETMEENVSPPNRRPLEIIGRHTDRLVRLVQDLALLAEVEEGQSAGRELEPVELADVVQSVVALFEARARERGINLTVSAEAGLPPVPADRYRLEQVFVNLVDNALNYTEHGGTVTVRLRRDDGRVAVDVADTGIGIERRHLSRIFERFYVADKSRSRQAGGTGLGLAIVKHIVALHGGEVTVQSEPGVGSTFTVRLPTVAV